MKKIPFDPFGNPWERLKSAYILFRYPQAFTDAIIREFVANVSGRVQSAMEGQDFADQPVPAEDPGSPELAIAASLAREEANNG